MGRKNRGRDRIQRVRSRESPPAGMTQWTVGMELEFLVPGVQHAEEADLGTEMSGVTSHFQQGFGAGPKQQTIDQFLVLQGQRSQLVRQSENDMDVGGGEKFATTCLDPAFAGADLALRAMAIATRNGEHPITCLMGSSP